MVRKCQVCGKMDYLSPEVSFHRFPTDPEKRKKWFSVMGLEANKVLAKHPEICSDHFNPKDIITRANGLKYITRGADPTHNAKLFEETSSTSSAASSDDFSHLQPIDQVFEVPLPSTSRNQDILVESSVESNILQINPASNCELTSSPQPGPSSFQFIKQLKDSSLVAGSTSISDSDSDIGKQTGRNILKRKRLYIGDMSSSDFSTPRKRRKNLNAIKTIAGKQRKKVHHLQMAVRRLKIRITNLTSLINYLKDKALISEDSESTIRASLSGPAVDIFERMLRGPKTQKYNESIRSFALTLSFYSARAYNFVRKTFNKTLPHLATISKWYKSVDGRPGFTNEALAALTQKQKDSSKQLLCNLVMDEMSIRRQVEWTGQKFTGYVDIGSNLESDTLPEAKEVLVFMLVCLNGSWKIPVGYFLLDGLGSTAKAELVNKCLQFIHDSEVLVTSFTFDGAPVNLLMAEKLGADFKDPKNLTTSFKHPVTNENIYIYLDACHMVKLVRNCLASQTDIKDKNGGHINWNFIKFLVEKQTAEGLHSATKIRSRHIQWEREKMKVRLATQTLSRSVSVALNYLREDIKCEKFFNSEATEVFILNFNNLFDIFNSRNKFAKYQYKRPFSPETAKDFLECMDILKDYILGLTIKDVPVTKTGRKTGFLGFLICIESLKKMYDLYVNEKKLLKFILTYKLSQDHLELFFGTIRSRGGHNNNPSARQFEAAYKRLLVNSQIGAPNSGNAINLEEITILTCGSNSSVTKTESDENLEEAEEFTSYMDHIKTEIDNNNYLTSNAWDLTFYVKDIVGYIAGFVVKGLKKCITCSKCLILLENEEINSLLQVKKTYGKLIKASNLVIEVCKAGEKFFRFFHTTESIFNVKARKLCNILIINTIKTLDGSVFDHFGDHLFDYDLFENHSIDLIKLILKNYFNIRIHHEISKNLDLAKKNRSRSIHTKLVLFKNE